MSLEWAQRGEEEGTHGEGHGRQQGARRGAGNGGEGTQAGGVPAGPAHAAHGRHCQGAESERIPLQSFLHLCCDMLHRGCCLRHCPEDVGAVTVVSPVRVLRRSA